MLCINFEFILIVDSTTTTTRSSVFNFNFSIKYNISSDMSLMFAKSFAEAGASSRKGGRKSVMGRGKFHHRGGPGGSGGPGGAFGGIRGGADGSGEPDHLGHLGGQGDDGPFRTHLLFPGKRDDDGGASPSFMRTVFGWGKKANYQESRQQQILLQQQIQREQLQLQREQLESQEDPFRPKQVSFMDGEEGRILFERPEIRPNNYRCDPPKHVKERFPTGFSEPFRESDYVPGRRPQQQQQQQQQLQQVQVKSNRLVVPKKTSTSKTDPKSPEIQPKSGAVTGLLAAVGGQAAAAATGGKLTRSPACDPYAVNGQGPPRDRGNGGNGGNIPSRRGKGGVPRRMPKDLQGVNMDCFIIPQGNLQRFLPDGISLPDDMPQRRHPLISVLEVDDPGLGITFHLMPRLSSLNPHLDSPLAAPGELQRELAQNGLDKAKELNATEGFVLKNLEKDSDYPFINYYVIEKPRSEAEAFYRSARGHAYDKFNPSRLGYKCDQSIDLFEEVATIARPPVDSLQSKRPITEATGYILCVYKVFKGDDGEKFERNWLYWSGARMLYKNLPRAVGLRRITLHKSRLITPSVSGPNEVTYILLVECSQFMDHIGEAANLLPTLRGRICGYTGIYRVCSAF